MIEAMPKPVVNGDLQIMERGRIFGELRAAPWKTEAVVLSNGERYEIRGSLYLTGRFEFVRDGEVIARARRRFFGWRFDVDFRGRTLRLRSMGRKRYRVIEDRADQDRADQDRADQDRADQDAVEIGMVGGLIPSYEQIRVDLPDHEPQELKLFLLGLVHFQYDPLIVMTLVFLVGAAHVLWLFAPLLV